MNFSNVCESTKKKVGTQVIPDRAAILYTGLQSRKKQQLEPDTEQWIGSKLGKEYVNAVFCHPTYLTYMQSVSCEMSGWMNHKLESSFHEETAITLDMQMTPPLWQKVKKH